MAFSFYTYAPNGAIADDMEHTLDSIPLGKRRTIERLPVLDGSVAIIVHYSTRTPAGAQLVRDLTSEGIVVQMHLNGVDLNLRRYRVPYSKKTRK